MPEFSNLDDIDRHYARAIREAGEDEQMVRTLQIEQREAQADFKLRAADARQLQVERDAIISRYRIDPELTTLVPTNGTLEQIEAAAKLIAAKTVPPPVAQDTLRRDAAAAYGNPVAGGQADPVNAPDGWERMTQFAEKFNNAPTNQYGQKEGLTQGEINEYVGRRGAEELHRRLKPIAEMQYGRDMGRRS